MIIFWAVWLLAFTMVLTFGAVLLVGAPYVPTLREARTDALELLALKPGQVLYELGSGDGSLLIEAAQRDLKVVGYELNPFLVVIAWLRTRRYRRQISIKWGNFWRADFAKADGVFVFLLDRYMERLDNLLKNAAGSKDIRLVSHAFKIPGKKPLKKKGAMRLYTYGRLANHT